MQICPRRLAASSLPMGERVNVGRSCRSLPAHRAATGLAFERPVWHGVTGCTSSLASCTVLRADEALLTLAVSHADRPSL